MKRHEPIAYVHLESRRSPSIFIDYFDDWTEGEGTLYAPHRHAYHEVVWFQTGCGLHLIDEQSISIMPHSMALITQGQVHSFREVETLSGYAICFTDDFLGLDSARQDQSHLTLFNYLRGDQTVQIPLAERARGEALLALIAAEYTQVTQDVQTDVLRHLVAAFLLQIERISRDARRARAKTTPTEEGIYWDFVRLLERQFTHHHDVAFYERALHCTPDQLSAVLQQVLGKPAKRVIFDRVLLEARRYLQFTTLPIKEIAASLGFADPFHFSKRFKQETGFAPQVYRKQTAN